MRLGRWVKGNGIISQLHPDVPLELRININGLFHLFINGIYWGYNPLILTFDPNFLGHPSIVIFGCSSCLVRTKKLKIWFNGDS